MLIVQLGGLIIELKTEYQWDLHKIKFKKQMYKRIFSISNGFYYRTYRIAFKFMQMCIKKYCTVGMQRF